MAAWRKDVLIRKRTDDRPFPVGYRGVSDDAVAGPRWRRHGGIRRSASGRRTVPIFTNWTSTDDAMTWDIEIAAAGEFTAEIFYTCPPASVDHVRTELPGKHGDRQDYNPSRSARNRRRLTACLAQPNRTGRISGRSRWVRCASRKAAGNSLSALLKSPGKLAIFVTSH